MLKANCISAISFLFGFNLVTHFSIFLLITILSLVCIKKDPSKDLIEVRFLSLKLEISITLKFFFFLNISKDSLSKPLASITSKKFLLFQSNFFIYFIITSNNTTKSTYWIRCISIFKRNKWYFIFRNSTWVCMFNNYSSRIFF